MTPSPELLQPFSPSRKRASRPSVRPSVLLSRGSTRVKLRSVQMTPRGPHLLSADAAINNVEISQRANLKALKVTVRTVN